MLKAGKNADVRGDCLRLLSTHLLFTFVTVGIQFFTTLLLPRYLSPEKYGRLGIFLSLLYFVAFRYWGNLNILVQPKINKANFKSIISYGLPSLVAVAGAWALNEPDKILIVKFVGLEEAGIYTAAATLCAVMMTFFMALTNSIMPRLFVDLKEVDGIENRLILIRKYLLYFIIPWVLFCIAMLLFVNYFSVIVLPEIYFRSLEIFNTMAPLMLIIALYRPFGLCLEYYKLSVFRMWSISGAGIVALATSYICIHSFGYQWAVIGLAAGYLYLTATSWRKLRRYES